MQLVEWRQRRGMTKVELAELIGVSVMQLYRYEKGRCRPSPEVMRRIAHVTGGAVLPNDFYDLPDGHEQRAVACGGERP